MTERQQITGLALMFAAVLLFAITMAMWQSATSDAAYDRELQAAQPVDDRAVSPNRLPSLVVGSVATLLFGSGIAVLTLGAITEEQRAVLRLRRPGRPEGEL